MILIFLHINSERRQNMVTGSKRRGRRQPHIGQCTLYCTVFCHFAIFHLFPLCIPHHIPGHCRVVPVGSTSAIRSPRLSIGLYLVTSLATWLMTADSSHCNVSCHLRGPVYYSLLSLTAQHNFYSLEEIYYNCAKYIKIK